MLTFSSPPFPSSPFPSLSHRVADISCLEEFHLDVRGKTLSLILMFIEHHLEVPFVTIVKPLPSSHLPDFMSPWDATFFGSLPQTVIYELVLASNYVGSPDCLDAAAGAVAAMVREKPIEELRREMAPQTAGGRGKQEEEEEEEAARWVYRPL